MRLTLITVIMLLAGITSLAQESPAANYLIYVWQGKIYARDITNGAPIELMDVFDDAEKALPDERYDAYSITETALTPSQDGYGFRHGVWSPDRSHLVYVERESAGLGYRVRGFSDGGTKTYIEGQFSTENGYLDPLAWVDASHVLLITRVSHHTLNTVYIQTLNIDTGALESYSAFDLPLLTGRSAVFPDGESVFIGFDSENRVGYTYNVALRRVFGFSAPFTVPEPPKSIFQTYPFPVSVLGMTTEDRLPEFRSRLNTALSEQVFAIAQRPARFLHWPLPDESRNITCYPDGRWTRAHFAVTCPSIGRVYEGHQGTDVGGLPDGLPLNTPVYAAAPGVVVLTYSGCDADDDMDCGAAYGNYVMLEHSLVIAGDVQTWFTGYAHLTTPLVEPFTVIDDLTQPIALSGATGLGGPHLHFELRQLSNTGVHRWEDPWGAYHPPHEQSMWLGSNDHPLALVGDTID